MSSYSGRSVLVVGGAGFIGSHLVEALASRGARISVVDDLSTGSLDNLASVSDRIEFHERDLARKDLRPVLGKHPVDTIFHLAGNAYVPPSVENPRLDFEKNVVGTFNLLEAVRAAAPAARVLYTSSAAVYAENAPMPFREDAATIPISPYGAGKLAAERYVAVYARLYGVPTAILRLFPVYGPRLKKQVVFDLIRKVHDNPTELFIHGDGNQVRDFNHISNVVEALLVAGERAAFRGEVYNLASEEAVTIRQLAQMICDAIGAKPRFIFSGDVRPGDAQRWSGDASRLKSLGYCPRLGLVEGLRDTVAWFQRDLEAPLAQPDSKRTT